jgi:oxygen-independent coproporphyrinogen-3 oxidase
MQTDDLTSATAGLYIHIPFCITKCPYCSFASRPLTDQDLTGYLEAVLAQARTMGNHPWTQGIRFTSLFVGGGTPTVYPGADLARLIESCLALLPFTATPEISVEANPNTVNREKLQTLRSAGVNRLSIGVQSFSDRLLVAIGRAHTAKEAHTALNLARATGFTNLNLDLIYGLPGQTLSDWQTSLNTAMTIGPEHLSLYELMVETGTRFGDWQEAGKLALPAEDETVAMAEAIPGTLKTGGYDRYEISNYSRPGHQCAHNLIYWRNHSYLGLGAGAVSSFSGLRVKTVADPGLFIKLLRDGLPPFQEGECLPLEAAFRETVIMGLRLVDGLAIRDLENRFGLSPLAYYGPALQKLESLGLLAITAGHLRLTPKGLPIANQALSHLV